MTAKTDLLPLPGLPNIGAGGQWVGWSDDDMHTYASACVSSATEALRRSLHEAVVHGNRQSGRAERLAEALRESHGEVLRLRGAMFRVYATAANGGDPTMAIEQMRDEMDKPWSGDKARAALLGLAADVLSAAPQRPPVGTKLCAQPEARGVVDDPQNALIGTAFLTVLRDQSITWRDRPEAADFIRRVAETCAEQNPDFKFVSALTEARNVR